MNKFIVINSNKLFDGDVVTIESYGSTRWIFHRGWYIYENTPSSGWYFQDLDTNVVLPYSHSLDDEISQVTVDDYEPQSDSPYLYPDDSSHCPCPPKPPCPHPLPPDPDPVSPCCPDNYVKITKYEKSLYDAAFITLDTLEDLHRLNPDTVPDGKIVKINTDDEGEVSYYTYNKETQTWTVVVFGSGVYWQID